MRLQPHDKDDGCKVWLSDNETQMLIEELGNADRRATEKRMAGKLGARAGLRRDEASKTRSIDNVQPDVGPTLWVGENQAKRDKYRETPIPDRLSAEIEAYADAAGRDPDEPVIDATGKTLNRWVQRDAERLYAETGDEGWLELSYHDLRRTWGTRLLEHGVLPTVVMSWGGWTDWNTFREAYLGEFSPEAMKRERGKVGFLATITRDVKPGNPQNHLVPIGSGHRQRP